MKPWCHMPLKIRVKPEGVFTVGEARLKNASKRPIDIVVLSEHVVQREEYTKKLKAIVEER